MKTIYIFLTRSTTIVSKLVYTVTADEYTHVAISFDKSFRELYSSGRKNGRTMFPAGPCKESIQQGYLSAHGTIPCAVYELKVSDEVYEKAKQEAENIMERADEYHYNIIGLLLCHFKIPFQRRYHFFCSQLVSEVLMRSNALKLPKDTTLMKPSDYMCLPELVCCFEGCINELPNKQVYPSVA